MVLPRFQGHDLYEQARAIVGPRTGTLTTLYDPRYDDHISEVVLALLEDRDPREALKLSKRFFVNYEYHTRDISIVMFRDNGGSATLET